jgi:4-amino-4-deoxy-L-arabinose transferase-like glycosyltransferase
MTTLKTRPVVTVGLILLLALGLRLINLSGRALWYDEAFAVLFSEKGVDAMLDGTLTPVEGGAADVHPLLYYITLDYWIEFFGESPIAVRLYSVLIGVVTVGAIYGLARDWFDHQTALVAALIVAIAPFHVQYSQEARMYVLLALMLTLTTWIYWRAWQNRGIGYWIGFGLLAGISMYIQQLAAFYLMALGLLPFVLRDRARIIRTVCASLLALVIYLPWMLYLPDQLGKLRQYWVQKPNILHFWLTLRTFISVNLDFSAGWWLPTFLLAAVLTVLLLYRAYPVLRAKVQHNPDRLPLLWVVWLAFVPMILMWITSYLFQPIFLPRALLPSAVMFYVAMAWLFTRGGMPQLIVGALAVSWGVIIVFGLVTHYTWDTFPTPPFEDAAYYLAQHSESGDVIVHGNKITALPMVYYERDLPQRYVRDIPDSGSDTLAIPTQKALQLMADECAAEAAAGAPRVWYVTFEQLEDEMADLVDDDPENTQYDSLKWLRQHYRTETLVRRFNDLKLYLFSDPDSALTECE